MSGMVRAADTIADQGRCACGAGRDGRGVAKCAVEMEGMRAEAAWVAQGSGVVEWTCDVGWVRE